VRVSGEALETNARHDAIRAIDKNERALSLPGPACHPPWVDGPYREPKPLSELIPPDRRKQKTVALVLGSMVTGIVLYELVGRLLADSPPLKEFPAPPPLASTTREGATPMPFVLGSLTREEIESVVTAHHRSLRERCWDGRKDAPSISNMTLTLIVGANGDVVSTSASGNDAIANECVERMSRGWRFIPHGERSAPIKIPIHFQREGGRPASAGLPRSRLVER
jgi:hypothetical protein